MERNYATADVFTATRLSGNPVAVVRKSEGLTSEQMQALAAEFNYVETTFLFTAKSHLSTALLRIFTPDREIPFAGHPIIGTAFLLAQETIRNGFSPPGEYVFDVAGGNVGVRLLYEGGNLVGGDLLSPQPLSRLTEVSQDQVAACLGLSSEDVRVETHMPEVVSVGLPVLVVELASGAVLKRIAPQRAAYDALLPLATARSIYAYTRESKTRSGSQFLSLNARMFTWRLVEDPATGSAVAALAALLADISGTEIRLSVHQGEDMGRSSLLFAHSVIDGGKVWARVGGHCVSIFRGTFEL